MSVTLTYTDAQGSVVSTLELPSPQLSNVDSFDAPVSSYRMYNGAIHTYKRTPTANTKTWKFVAMSKAKRDALVTFLNVSIGKIITVLDWNNDTFSGVIVSDNVQFTASSFDGYFDTEFNLRMYGTAPSVFTDLLNDVATPITIQGSATVVRVGTGLGV